jgi:hypothetical protein
MSGSRFGSRNRKGPVFDEALYPFRAEMLSRLQFARTLVACGPLRPCPTSNSTSWPSRSDLNPSDWMFEKCTNKSSPPSSGVMKPNPFFASNHFTLPLLTALLLRPSLLLDRDAPIPSKGIPLRGVRNILKRNQKNATYIGLQMSTCFLQKVPTFRGLVSSLVNNHPDLHPYVAS